jgi:flagellum-specific peptidoglycan hydrolase FlgJ
MNNELKFHLQSLPGRAWYFLKTNWFSSALALLLLVAVVKKQGRKSPAKQTQQSQTEKMTQAATAAETPTQLGISSEMQAGTPRVPDIDASTAMAFFTRFGPVAAGERKKFGIPASVLLGCAYVNSYAGGRKPAQQANNYFALGCSPDWDGGAADCESRCMRRYNTAWESFRDFSIWLAGSDWWGDAKKSAGKDWRKWAKILGEKEVSDVQNFESELVKAIEEYKLYELDK